MKHNCSKRNLLAQCIITTAGAAINGGTWLRNWNAYAARNAGV